MGLLEVASVNYSERKFFHSLFGQQFNQSWLIFHVYPDDLIDAPLMLDFPYLLLEKRKESLAGLAIWSVGQNQLGSPILVNQSKQLFFVVESVDIGLRFERSSCIGVELGILFGKSRRLTHHFLTYSQCAGTDHGQQTKAHRGSCHLNITKTGTKTSI